MTVWTIECDALDKRSMIQADNDIAMVKILVYRGFKRILSDDVPYQAEPLVYEDSDGEIWDAMPAIIMEANNIPHMDSVSQQ